MNLERIAETDAHEGPVHVAEDDALYFTTVPVRDDGRAPRVAIKRLDLRDGGIEVVRPAANVANGMALARDGRLVVCEQGTLGTPDLKVQRRHAIDEYTDPHHAANVPHTLVLAPGLVIDKVYVGYWFWGRPSPYRLWDDVGDLLRRIKPDFDPTTAEARAAWEAAQEAGAPA